MLGAGPAKRRGKGKAPASGKARRKAFTVTAILAAYNEDDIIAQVVGDLVAQGIRVYLLDHGSTDDTVAEVQRYLKKGLIGIERFPPEGAPGQDRFSLEAILRRKTELASELDSDWFINQDADEIRESPWLQVGLYEGILRVDALGYNAIDFEVLNFWPTHDDFKRGDDLRKAFGFYEPGGPFDRLQIRCWKKPKGPFDLLSSGGHEVLFEGRKVFPLRFLLRHYPVRNQAQGERKVFQERQPRFDPAERERGWHVQYDGIASGHVFIREEKTLRPYDAEAVRVELTLRHRGVEDLERDNALQRQTILGLEQEEKRLNLEITRLESALATRGREIEELNAGVQRSSEALVVRGREVEELNANVRRSSEELARLQSALATRGGEVEDLNTSVQRSIADLRARGDEVERLNAQLTRLSSDLAVRGIEVESLNASVARSAEALRARGDEVGQLNDEVARLAGGLVDRDSEVSGLNADLKRLGREADSHRRGLEDLRVQLAACRREGDQRLEELRKRGRALFAHQAQLKAIRRSLSWRITAPLRISLDTLRRRRRGTP